MTTSRVGRGRTEAFLHRWRPILPLLVAEAIIWLGFGAILPILPLYMSDNGIDPVTLGLVMAAWPAARLVAEPIFGWLADRTPRVPFMVVGLLISTSVSFLPLVLVGPVWFFAARFVSGIGAAMYDPAARGFIVDATDDQSHGEAFGVYGAAQMGGFIVGPAIGGIGGAVLGTWFPFVFATVAGIVAAIYLGVVAREPGRHHPRHGIALPPADGSPGMATTPPLVADGVPTRTIWLPPASMWNRMLVSAVIVNFGAFFASGTYEVVWSLFMERLGASLTLIGISFAIFGVPVIFLAPVVGRWVDRVGSLRFIILGSALIIVAAFLYPLVGDPYLVIGVSLIDATGFALLSPAVYAVVSWGSPAARSSTAQGLFGAAGTLGFIVSSLLAGELWSRGVALPFQAFGATMLITTVIALAVGRGRLDGDDPSLMRQIPIGPAPGVPATKEGI
jgi:DHA1 family multidrug resistance protein-like MFS transporter